MAPLHYVEGKDDYLSERCEWSWQELAAMRNMIDTLQYWDGEQEEIVAAPAEALKFLVHFYGDLHQPLHLAGRARGGNGINV